MSKSDENREAQVSRTYSARGYFASDTLSSDPNACPLISTFSRPHSEVASTTHIPALKGVPRRRFAVFWFIQDGRSPDKCSA